MAKSGKTPRSEKFSSGGEQTPREVRNPEVRNREVRSPESYLVSDDEHPDYVGGVVADAPTQELTPNPDDPVPSPFPPIPEPMPAPGRPEIPRPFPGGQPLPWPIQFCGPVSGRYSVPAVLPPIPAVHLAGQPAIPVPDLTPLFGMQITVRVDVDRFYPQNRISIEVVRRFPAQRAHVIGTVSSDRCSGIYQRRIEATVTYRDGVASLIPADRVIFEASRTGRPFAYGRYQITLISAGGARKVYPLNFVSQYFDTVEFEVDQVQNATPVVTSYNTGAHPNCPTSLPIETVDFRTTFRRAGFDVSMSPNVSTIPLAGAGANSTWSDTEMHNAMVTFWSRFAHVPRWFLWVLFAARHDMGRTLGGIMFDDIGPNHRQGTAIFTDSFIVDAPAGDANPAAWRDRSIYWTAVHEMGHAFNLAHSWQKSLGRPDVQGDPWIPLTDEPEARSFMNYPNRVTGGQAAFYSNFEFRFSDTELVFMRHAPRRFVQMGNENWFENHAFEQQPDHPAQRLKLHLRTHRDSNSFAFLEPVKVELKLENVSDSPLQVQQDAIQDDHAAILVGRDNGGKPAKWRPFASHCHQVQWVTLAPGEALYASHFVSASGQGWLIAEPGFYTIQTACHVDGAVVVSNPLRIFVGTPNDRLEEDLAPEYFVEDVARVLAFQGAPDLAGAQATLEEIATRLPGTPAATHATIALAKPQTRDFKRLETGGGRGDMAITTTSANVQQAIDRVLPVLVDSAEAAADTLGHIDYRRTVETFSVAIADAGNTGLAADVQKNLIATMQQRGVLQSVISDSARTLQWIAESARERVAS